MLYRRRQRLGRSLALDQRLNLYRSGRRLRPGWPFVLRRSGQLGRFGRRMPLHHLFGRCGRFRARHRRVLRNGPSRILLARRFTGFGWCCRRDRSCLFSTAKIAVDCILVYQGPPSNRTRTATAAIFAHGGRGPASDSRVRGGSDPDSGASTATELVLAGTAESNRA